MSGKDQLSALTCTHEYEALRHLELALHALDRSDAPFNIGALVDQALNQLKEHLAALAESESRTCDS